MKKNKKIDEKAGKLEHSAVYPYTTKKPISETIYNICTASTVSFDIGKIINGQPRKS